MRLRNAGAEPYHLAPWVLTMFAQGGTGIHGFPPRGTHPEMLEPTNPLVMWAFTHLDDPRWRLSRKYLVLRQDPKNSNPAKAGHVQPPHLGRLPAERRTVREAVRGDCAPASAYPDFGCTFETFTNADILELETLGPLTTLAPGQSVSHTERWTAHRDVKLSTWTDDELDAVVLPLI